MLVERYHAMEPPKFLYGTHYSTPAYVLFFLVRAAPDLALRVHGGALPISGPPNLASALPSPELPSFFCSGTHPLSFMLPLLAFPARHQLLIVRTSSIEIGLTFGVYSLTVCRQV